MFSGRNAVAIFVALLLAAAPLLASLSTAYAAQPHAAMAMGDAGSDHGCCPEQDSSAAAACFAHCAAGTIDASTAVVLDEAVPACPIPTLVQVSASRAPPPDTAPPKSSLG